MPFRAVNNVLCPRSTLPLKYQIFSLQHHLCVVKVCNEAFWRALTLPSQGTEVEGNRSFFLLWNSAWYARGIPALHRGRAPAVMLAGGKGSYAGFAYFSSSLISFTLSREPKWEIGGWKAAPESSILMAEINSSYTWQRYLDSVDLHPKQRLT